VFWLRPSDIAFDQRVPDGIAQVMFETQRYYQAELGKTIALNDPIVEVVVGEHNRTWYETTPIGGDSHWYPTLNMVDELTRRFNLPGSGLYVGEISAQGANQGGGARTGFVHLTLMDVDGAAGLSGNMNRWYGGMVHELGHALGLPDSTSTDGTPMSASFYSYPNTHFTQAQQNSMLSGPRASFLL
jgi:hypothetical protein